MSTRPFIVAPGDREPSVNVVGVQVTILAPAGAIADQQVTVQAGGQDSGPPPHSHDWDETFYVTKGQVDFMVGGRVTACPVGTLAHVPAGTVHAFSFGAGGGEVLEFTGRRSNATAMFAAVAREIPAGPLDLEKAIEILGKNGVTVHS